MKQLLFIFSAVMKLCSFKDSGEIRPVPSEKPNKGSKNTD